jgi:hypothetical protein
MKRIASCCALIALLMVALARSAWADGGTLQLVEEHGDIQIAIFTAPNPLRAGPVDISLLAQDTRTGQALDELPATVTLTPLDGEGSPIRAALLRANATNQLMQSALVELPAAGKWRGQLVADFDGRMVTCDFTLVAGPPLPRWWSEWPWFTWPVLAVGLFVAHRWRVQRLGRSGRRREDRRREDRSRML